jgi:hypothetical protein
MVVTEIGRHGLTSQATAFNPLVSNNTSYPLTADAIPSLLQVGMYPRAAVCATRGLVSSPDKTLNSTLSRSLVHDCLRGDQTTTSQVSKEPGQVQLREDRTEQGGTDRGHLCPQRGTRVRSMMAGT